MQFLLFSVESLLCHQASMGPSLIESHLNFGRLGVTLTFFYIKEH